MLILDVAGHALHLGLVEALLRAIEKVTAFPAAAFS
jgi:hypothetical protein